jgi:uncharacterized protein YsxB (DUF464 family)
MINVIFKRKNSKLVSFDICGHAGYDTYGNDIVCSGVSAISTTIVNGIIEVLNIEVSYEIKDGFLSLNLIELSDQDIDKCSVLMETMLLGFRSMMINYSEYINVTIEEV